MSNTGNQALDFAIAERNGAGELDVTGRKVIWCGNDGRYVDWNFPQPSLAKKFLAMLRRQAALVTDR